MKRVAAITTALLTTGLLCGCTGDTDGGKAGDEDFSGTQYVASGNAGSITIEPTKTVLGIGEVTGFFVTVRDSSGVGVPNIQVACDTEVGLPLIEPVRGFELTSEDGRMSAKVGCRVPGSLSLVCRMPLGGSFRAFAHFKCEGSVPTGFTGFGETGGETLGAGVAVNDDGSIGGTNLDGVRIASIQYNDTGNTATGGETDGGTTSIDISQIPDCDFDAATPGDFEPFFDTLVTVNVVNNTNRNIRFTHMRVSIPNLDGFGSDFRSQSLALIGDTESSLVLADGGTNEFTTLVFDARGGQKGPKGTSVNFSSGFRSIRVTLFGTTSDGDEIELNASTELSFDGFNNCGAS